MKKTFSALLMAVFAAYAFYWHQSGSGANQPAITIADQPAEPSAPSSVSASAPPNPPATPATTTAIPSAAPTAPAVTPAPQPPPVQQGKFKDGNYKGDSVYAYYGYVQVAAVIQGGKLADVQIYDYPRDRRTSASINSQALPMLISEAVSAQSANIRSISGASDTSPAFKQSLASALAQAAR